MTKRQAVGLAAGIVVLSILAACGDNTVPVNDPANNTNKDDKTCTYKSKVYQDQQQWKDDCNDCKCNAEGTSGASCTQMACPPIDPPEGTCTFEGKVYKDQDKWMHDCNSCWCDAATNGAVCTTLSCDEVPCGDTSCGGNQICVYLCCGGSAWMCEPKNKDGTCPPGFHEGSCSVEGTDGCEADPCTPPSYCADEAPVSCEVNDRVASCPCS